MITLDIVNFENGYLHLKDAEGKITKLLFEFYDFTPTKKGKILISEELLDINSASFCQPYAFELSKEKVEYKINTKNKDFIAIKSDDKIFILKRIYG